jgi:SAM-dependent methyltransferase
MEIDPRAAAAWGADASGYEAARPGWPPEALDWLWDGLGLGPDAEVLDLAAGTGKLTRALLERTAGVVAVEPLEGMRAQLTRTGARVLEGTAEAIPLEDAAVDAVFVAEAFHWFATTESVAEIARVLRPGGGIALLWNLERIGDDWQAQAATFGIDTGLDHHPHERANYDAVRRHGAFEEPQERRFPREVHYSADALAALVGSWSFVAGRPPEDRERILAMVRDNVPIEGVAMGYDTLAVVARLHS